MRQTLQQIHTVVSLTTLVALVLSWQGHKSTLPQPVFTYYAGFCVEELKCECVGKVTLVTEL